MIEGMEAIVAAMGGAGAWAGAAKLLETWRRGRLREAAFERQGVQDLIRDLRAEVDRQRGELNAMRADVAQCHAERASLLAQVDEVQRALSKISHDTSRWSLVEPSSKLPTVYTDESGVIQDFSPQAVALFGWTREEALGQDVAALLVAPSYRQAHLSAVRRMREDRIAPDTGRVRQGEAVTRDGRTIQVQVRLKALMRLGSWLIAAEVWPLPELDDAARGAPLPHQS